MDGNGAPGATDSFARHMDHVAAAFALTHGRQHTLTYANAAFHHLVAPHRVPRVDAPIADVFPARDRAGLTALLDRAFRTGIATRSRLISAIADRKSVV